MTGQYPLKLADLGGGSYAFVVSDAGGSITTPVSVPNGGTGLATLTAHNIIVGNGAGNVGFIAPGTAGQVLTSNGASADPTFQDAGGGGAKAFAGGACRLPGDGSDYWSNPFGNTYTANYFGGSAPPDATRQVQDAFVIPAPCTVSKLYVHVGPSTAGDLLVVNVEKNGTVALTTVVAAGEVNGNSAAGSFTAVAGDVLTMKLTNSSGNDPVYVSWGFQYEITG